MSRRGGYIGLDWPLADAEITRDGAVEMVMGAGLQARIDARDRELDAMIAMGWGATDSAKIPTARRFRPIGARA